MSELLKAMVKETSKTTTENGMKTFTTSLNSNLDLFFMGGASRNKTESEIINMFSKAYHEDSKLALQILAFIRDCRGGMGERRFFRIIVKHLAQSNKSLNLSQIPELGRWDDIFELFNTPYENDALEVIKLALEAKNGLCAKWMPRKGEFSRKLRNYLKLTPKEYRKVLVTLTNVVETKMCNKEWGGIEYSKVPSVANIKYNKAFLRNDEARRREFLSKAVKGEVKINSSVAFPHDIIGMMISTNWNSYYNSKGFISPAKNDTAEAMWKQLPDYLKDNSMNLLTICDTSGSMAQQNEALALKMSLALGLYISERSNGIFKDAFITFSEKPELQYTKGTLYERLSQIKAIHPSSTNLEATFELVLNTAIKHKISNSEMPTHLLIISDMEFNTATRPNHTALKMIKSKYKQSGYNMPNIIFWNVNSRQENIPVRFDKDDVGLVSGASPSVIKTLLSGKFNPMDIVYEAVNKEKYTKLISN